MGGVKGVEGRLGGDKEHGDRVQEAGEELEQENWEALKEGEGDEE